MNTTSSRGTGLSWDELPATITAYLPAHQAHDTTTAIAAFAADAEVTDDGRTYRGREQIEAWMRRSSSEYSYTTEFVGAARDGGTGWDVVQHLAGDFPGGSVDLHYRFTLDGDAITRLVIEP
jgi:SnoaL-like domain